MTENRAQALARLFLVFVLLLASVAAGAGAQDPGGRGPTVTIPRLERPPRLEEFLTMEPAPELRGKLALVEGFTQQSPEDGQPATQTTHVYLGYDGKNMYAVFVAFDSEPEKIRAHVARRESVFGDDIVEIQLDTFNDERRAFSFIANPFGIQWDAIWTEGQGFDESWDTVWQSRGQVTDRGYVVLMAIPLRSLRFPQDPEQTWGVVLVRDIPRNNESSFWPRVSNRIEGRLNQAGALAGLRGISPGRNIDLIPYTTSRNFRALDPATASFDANDLEADAGLDAKLVIKDRLALDLTLNPDFSQVESDQPQVTVNQRFEVFFPEKRPFFLENAGLFDARINLLFTRRIREPRLGARVSGKIGSYSLAALAIDDEAAGKEPGLPAALQGKRARFGVLRLVRDVSRQSNIGMIYTDREFEGSHNRVAGMDGRFKFGANWYSRFQAVYSRTREPTVAPFDDTAFSVDLNRDGRKFNAHLHYLEIGPEFRTEAGFVRRTDVRDLHQRVEYTFRPEGRRLVSWGPSLFVQRIEDHDGLRLDREFNPQIEWEFRGQTRLGLFIEEGRERLRPADFAGLAAARDFPANRRGLFFNTRVVNAVDLDTGVFVGKAINFVPIAGAEPESVRLTGLEIDLTLRPISKLRIDNTYLYTRLSDLDGDRKILTDSILRTRWNMQFNKRLSLRAIVQYETTLPDASRTRLARSKRLNGDLLLTYLIHPGTAVYAGYNTNYQNFRIVPGAGGSMLERTPGADLNDARQVFVKVSYLVRL